MKKLKIEQILRMHEILIEKTGGASGIRDIGSLDSAINLPFQSFDGEDIYKTVRAKSARLAYSIVNNHPFIDGNKRTGITYCCTNESLGYGD